MTPRLLSVKESAQYLGISKRYFYELGFARKIKRIQLGKKKYLYDVQDLDKLINKIKRERVARLIEEEDLITEIAYDY